MKKIITLVSVFFLVVFFASTVCKAGSLENGKNDHKGFMLGLGVGGGMINLSGSGQSETKGAFISDIKIGGGVMENLLIMYDGFFGYTKISGINFYLYTFPVAVQWYPWKGLYIRPGVGLSYAKASTTVSGINISTDTKASVGADFAVGYEFRFGKYFALSPEIVYHYNHLRSNISNGNANTFGAQASCVWFF